tara:strand:+ start:650 stop:1501 length:852 start_codon:yes stop_codon:yes gene_type:complete
VKRTPLIIISVKSLSPLALSIYGNETISTPHLDQLAWTGTVFHEYHSNHEGFAKVFEQVQLYCNENHLSFAPNSISVGELPAVIMPVERDILWYRIDNDRDETASDIVQAIEQLIYRIIQKLDINSCNWIITAESGGFLDKEQSSAASFAIDYQNSLTRQFWAPLIISPARENAEHCRNHSLLFVDDLLTLICEQSGLNSEFIMKGREEILLESENQIGLRTSKWLLCLPRTEIDPTNEYSHLLEEPELFAKPEDRFDLNDISQSEPELTSDLMQKLREMIKK